MCRQLLILCVGVSSLAVSAFSQPTEQARPRPNNVNLNTLNGTDSSGMPRGNRAMRRARQNVQLRSMQQGQMGVPSNFSQQQGNSLNAAGQARLNQGVMNPQNGMNNLNAASPNAQQFPGQGGVAPGIDFNGLQQLPDGRWVDQNGNLLSAEALRNLGASGSIDAEGSLGGADGQFNVDGSLNSGNRVNDSARRTFNRTPSALQTNGGIGGRQFRSNGQQQFPQNSGRQFPGQVGNGVHQNVRPPFNGGGNLQLPNGSLQGNGSVQGANGAGIQGVGIGGTPGGSANGAAGSTGSR